MHFFTGAGTGIIVSCLFSPDSSIRTTVIIVGIIKQQIAKKSVAMTMIRRMFEIGPILYENILQESKDKIDYFLQIEKSRIA